jgi:hypothetical protein
VILALAAGAALAGQGAVASERWLVAWSGETLAIYKASDLISGERRVLVEEGEEDEEAREDAAEEEPGGARLEVGKAVVDVFALGEAFMVLAEADGVRQLQLLQPEGATLEKLEETLYVKTAGFEPRSRRLVMVDLNGLVFKGKGLQQVKADEQGQLKRFLANGYPPLGSTRRFVPLEGLGMAALNDLGMTLLAPSDGEPLELIDAQTDALIEALAPLPGGRLVSARGAGEATALTRWSLLSPESPWPFPLGEYTLDGALIDLVEVPGGAWVVADAPLRRPPQLPGVAFGLPEGSAAPIAAAALPLSGQVALVGADLSAQAVAPPALKAPAPRASSAAAAEGDWAGWAAALSDGRPEVRALADAVRAADLPLGERPGVVGLPRRSEGPAVVSADPGERTRDSAGGGRLRWIEARTWELLQQPAWFDRAPLDAARAYITLAGLEGAMGQALAEAEAAASATRSMGLLWLGLLGFAGSWLAHRSARREREKEQALSLEINPFRADSPNNPSCVPFGAEALIEDLLRTLALNCVVIQGPQFSGKSALLRHVVWRLRAETPAGERRVIPVYLDLHGVPEDAFWSRLGAAIARAFPEASAAEEIREVLEEEEALDRDSVEYLLEEVLEDGGPRLLLVLKDLDTLGLYRNESQRFRGLIQIIPSHRMAVLGSGRNIRRGFGGGSDESPWFNLFQVREFLPWSEQAIAEYLGRRLEAPYTFESGVPARLHRLTSGRPLQVWHLLFSAVEQLHIGRRVDLGGRDLEVASAELRSIATAYAGEAAEEEADGEQAWFLRGEFDRLLAEDPEQAWEQLVLRIADARRQRDLLNQQLGSQGSAR